MDVSEKPPTDKSQTRQPNGYGGNGARAPSSGWAFIDTSSWGNQKPEPIAYTVPDRIPSQQVTLFSGEGAAGKSTIALHLDAAHVLARDWLGTMPEYGCSFFIDSEDAVRAIEWRRWALQQHYACNPRELDELRILSLAGSADQLLATVVRGRVLPTKNYEWLLRQCEYCKPRCITIANSANTFAGSEIDRNQVQQFVSLLTGLAIAADGAVVLLSHPSLIGINTNTGLSGSTQWHNAVRARMWLRSLDSDEQNGPRVLEFKKNQYGPVSSRIILEYRNGLFLPPAQPSTLEKLRRETEARDLFAVLLRRYGDAVSPKVAARNYAPRLFAQEREAKEARFNDGDMKAAMESLLRDNVIVIESYGRPAQPRTRLKFVETAT